MVLSVQPNKNSQQLIFGRIWQHKIKLIIMLRRRQRLNGWTMCNYLPSLNFRWLSERRIVILTFFFLSNNSATQDIQSNLDGSNTVGSFTMANSNSFLSPYEILLIAQENKYLRKFSYFIVKLYVVCTY